MAREAAVEVPFSLGWAAVATALLCASCGVMVVAWYLHLSPAFASWPVHKAVLFSWLIAGAEYALQVPANRVGHQRAGLSAAQLRAIAEAAILLAFLVFQTYALKAPLLWNHLVGFALVLTGVCVVLLGPLPSAVFGGAAQAGAAAAPLAMADGAMRPALEERGVALGLVPGGGAP